MQTTSPKDISIDTFDYALPDERIALKPVSRRDNAKLLVYRKGYIEDSFYKNIHTYLSEGSLMVFNNSKVVRARLLFTNQHGGKIEIFCLEPDNQQIDTNLQLQQTASIQWRCMVGGLKKWKQEVLSLWLPNGAVLHAQLLEKAPGNCLVRFSWTPESLTFGEILDVAGKIPLPPYIKRETDAEDHERYQTVYARKDGSVAAPTAGLHFTPEVLKKLTDSGIEVDYLTLHVGAGTFKPVQASRLGEHDMHAEQVVVDRAFLQKLISSLDQDVVAVGTTSLRTLESLYWLGLKIAKGLIQDGGALKVGQWDPYELDAGLTTGDALGALLDFMEKEKAGQLLANTQLLISPGYEWKVVNVLATNFHQPKSTLILLVAAFIGEQWREVYHHALAHDYRFLSYGDGSLLFRKQ